MVIKQTILPDYLLLNSPAKNNTHNVEIEKRNNPISLVYFLVSSCITGMIF